MNRQPIALNDFNFNVFHAWNKGWYLLTAGDFRGRKIQYDDRILGGDRHPVE